jgi:hypothetical protein
LATRELRLVDTRLHINIFAIIERFNCALTYPAAVVEEHDVEVDKSAQVENS